MCLSKNHTIQPFEANDLFEIDDRFEGDILKKVPEEFFAQLALECETRGPSYTVRCGDKIVASGGFSLCYGLNEHDDFWFAWLSGTHLFYDHRILLHKIAKTLINNQLKRTKKPIFATANRKIPQAANWLKRLGFMKIIDQVSTEINILGFDIDQYDLFVRTPDYGH